MKAWQWLTRRSDPDLFADRGLGVTVFFVAVFAIAAAVVGYAFLKWVVHPTTTGDKQAGDLDLVKALVAVAGLLGVVTGSVYAFRRHHLAARDTIRAQSQLHSDRYTAAAGQLGDDSAATRLAGAYAMARLADDWPEERQTCVSVLCAYLRLPRKQGDDADPEVRRTLLRVIRDHLRDDRLGNWRGSHLIFEGATFGRGNLTDAVFGEGGMVNFTDARFEGDVFHFTKVDFRGAKAWFDGAVFATGHVSFKGALIDPGQESLLAEARQRPGITADWGPFNPPPSQ